MTRMTLGLRLDKLGLRLDRLGLRLDRLGLRLDRLGLRLDKLGLFAAMVALGATLSMSGCAEETATGEQRVHIVKNNDAPAELGGISPDKQADIQLMLQQREPSVRKCYNDVLNDGSHDRTFKGTIVVLISLAPGSKDGARVTGVKAITDTLKSDDVTSCVTDKLKEFEYPDVANSGTMQYSYKFEPAY